MMGVGALAEGATIAPGVVEEAGGAAEAVWGGSGSCTTDGGGVVAVAVTAVAEVTVVSGVGFVSGQPASSTSALSALSAPRIARPAGGARRGDRESDSVFIGPAYTAARAVARPLVPRWSPERPPARPGAPPQARPRAPQRVVFFLSLAACPRALMASNSGNFSPRLVSSHESACAVSAKTSPS